jgi:hypothetical protein
MSFLQNLFGKKRKREYDEEEEYEISDDECESVLHTNKHKNYKSDEKCNCSLLTTKIIKEKGENMISSINNANSMEHISTTEKIKKKFNEMNDKITQLSEEVKKQNEKLDLIQNRVSEIFIDAKKRYVRKPRKKRKKNSDDKNFTQYDVNLKKGSIVNINASGQVESVIEPKNEKK